MSFDLAHVARLARLTVTDEERPGLEQDFRNILTLVDRLRADPISEKTERTLVASARRPDVPLAYEGPPVTGVAPAVEKNLFRVPLVLPP